MLDSVNVALSSQITNEFNNTNALMAQKFVDLNAAMNNNFSNLSASLNAKIDVTGQTIQTQLTDVNSTLYDLIAVKLTGDMNTQMSNMLTQLTAQVSDVKNDTNWLAHHAMNDTDKAAIDQRFNSLDNNLSQVEAFCSNSDTNSSALCQEIYNIKDAVAVMKAEQDNTLATINTTTTNTWNLLSGQIATNIDTLLTNIGIIKAQTTDINSTVHQILDNQESQVSVRIIS